MKSFKLFSLSLGFLISYNVHAQTGPSSPQFIQCDANIRARCASYGEPGKPIPFLLPVLQGQTVDDFYQNYPAPPPDKPVGSTVSFIYNCLYTNPAYPGEYNYYSGFIGTCSYVVGPTAKVELSISKLRVAQNVFEPSASDGATTDLVTKKPYAVEVTLSGTVPSAHVNLLARADLFVNRIFYLSSSPFKVGAIVNGQSKAFIFGQEDLAGAKNLRVDVVPVTPQAGIFDTTASVSRNVIFYETSLSLLVNEVTGCLPTVSNCFSAPTIQDNTFFDTKQMPFAQKILPISGGNLSVTRGINWALSNPNPASPDDSVYFDTAYIWIQKKLALKDIGVALVGSDYFAVHGQDEPGRQTLGLVLPNQQGVAILNSRSELILSHELIHNFKFAMDHSTSTEVEGVGSSSNEIWTTGQSLDPFIILGNLANNIFGEFAATSAPFGIGISEYNAAFKALRGGKIDPKVVLVTGILGPNGENKYFQAQRGDAFLDPVLVSYDLTIQGLNGSGVVVSSVPSQSSNKIERIKVSGEHEVIQTPSSFFAATLPDDGTVQSIRVTKGSQILYTEPVDKINLDSAIKGLYANSFKIKAQLAKAALKIIDVEYSNYLKAKQKRQSKVARIHLLIVREVIIASCKDQIPLENGGIISKRKLVELIDAELKLLK